MLILSLGFGLGVLAVVLADLAEKRRKRTRFVVVVDYPFAASSPRARAERAAEILSNYQDSTLK